MTNLNVALGGDLDRVIARALSDPKIVLAVVGPTASGKTALAIELAKRLNAEIIGCDSVQIYRHFDIGSGKPTAEERAQAVHHLLDECDPNEPIDASRYAELATARMDDISKRGKRVIVCGGTFLWCKALLFGLADAPRGEAHLRERHQRIATESGRPALHDELRKVDPISAARLHPNDFVRVSRALEVFELTGKPLSVAHGEHGFKAMRHPTELVGIHFDSAELTNRIQSRVQSWLREGWMEEVRSLIARGYEPSRPMGSVGYKQVYAHVRGELPESELEGAIVRATRIFARRQRTWLRTVHVTWTVPNRS